MDPDDQVIQAEEVSTKRPTYHKYFFYPLIALLIVSGVALGYYSQLYFRKGSGTIPVFTKKAEIAPTKMPKEDSLKSFVGKQVLFDSLQNFDDLTREDLPNFTDVRLVEPYEGMTLIMGFGRIAMYDKSEKKYVSMSDKTLSCATSAALIGKTLYVGCNSEEFAGPHRMFEIDMATRKITKAYLSTTFFGKLYNAVNLKFATVETMLWGSSWDGVFKYDTVNKKLTVYSYEDLHFPKHDSTWNVSTDCQKAFLYREKDLIKVLSQCDHTATYNEADDSWTTVHDPTNTLPPKINRTAEDFGLDLPSFVTYSDVRAGKRYLFTKNAVYTLVKGSFPLRLFDISGSYHNPYFGYVTLDENYAIIFGTFEGWPDMETAKTKLGDVDSFALIDLKTGSSTDLIKSSGLANEPYDNYVGLGQYWENSSFKEEGGSISLYKDGERIFSVNTLEKKITFTIPSPTPTP